MAGPHSPFFAKLGEQVLAAGHRVLRINFTSRDKFFWNGENTADYKYQPTEFADYINNVARLRKVTDMVIFGDNNEFTKAAIEALKNLKIRLYVFDHGYFGENWITMEDRLFGSKTVLPKDPRFYLRQTDNTEIKAKKFGSLSRAVKFHRLQYKLFGEAENFPADHVPNRNKRIKVSEKLEKGSYFLADFDLSRKASFMRNFATNAPEYAMLVFYSKNPLSQMQINRTDELTAKYNIAGRAVIVAGKAFRPLVKNAKAYITNGNISALIALKKSTPVMTLDNTIYNIEGLTSRLPLADFWNRPEKPDLNLLRRFQKYVIDKTQINGCFYNKQGIELAVTAALVKILGREVAGSQTEEFSAS